MSRKPKAQPRLEPPADTGPGVCVEAVPCLALFEPTLLLHSCPVSAPTPRFEPGRPSPRKVQGPAQVETPARSGAAPALRVDHLTSVKPPAALPGES